MKKILGRGIRFDRFAFWGGNRGWSPQQEHRCEIKKAKLEKKKTAKLGKKKAPLKNRGNQYIDWRVV